MQGGDYERGWPEYEWPWRRPATPPRPFRQPRWDGSVRESQTVLAKLRNWAAQVGEIRFTEDPNNPTISLQISGVDVEPILANAVHYDNDGNRRSVDSFERCPDLVARHMSARSWFVRGIGSGVRTP